MTDIVERLRAGEDEGVDGWWFVMAEAADEIERLRVQLAYCERELGAEIMDRVSAAKAALGESDE